jgi:hypothetical protein
MGGRSRSKTDLATVDARLASASDASGAAANSARDPRRHNQMPMSTLMIAKDTNAPIVPNNLATRIDQSVR